MFQQIYRWLQNITVYLIITAAVMHAVPGKDYGKYIRFFSGLILILLLATPLLNLTGMKEKFETLYKNNEYKLEIQEIESVEELYKESALSGYFQSQEECEEDGVKEGNSRIEVEEIEIGQ